MLIKQKSLIVALTSGCIISAVLVLTLIGYAAYTKIRSDNFRRQYDDSFKKFQAEASGH